MKSGRRGANRVTLADVARHAGVSAITVSRVVNQFEGVTDALRAKVEASIQALGYIPNRSASNLASSRSRVIGVLIPSLSNVVFNEVLSGIYKVAGPAGYQVLLADTHYSPLEEERSLRTILGQNPEGLIITGGDQTDAARQLLASVDLPIVQIMERLDTPLDMNVGFSHFEAAKAVVETLLSRHYRRIGFLGARMDPRSCQRLEGYREVLQQHGLLDERRVVTTPQPSSVGRGGELFRSLMGQCGGDLDAVFCCNDDLALGVLFACQKMHLSVPEQIGVCGFNDIEMAAQVMPGLSSVQVGRYEMGERAMKMIFARLNGELLESPYVDTGFKVVQRGSTRSGSTATLEE